MAFTVSDFQDLLRLLREKPEWQAELREILIGHDLAAIHEQLRLEAEGRARLPGADQRKLRAA